MIRHSARRPEYLARIGHLVVGCAPRPRRQTPRARRRCTEAWWATSSTIRAPASRARRSPPRAQETNQVSEQVTPENGTYSFPNLLPGTYQLTVTLPGFKTVSVGNIALRIGAIVRVDARLELGTLEESVTVTAGSAAPAGRQRHAAVADDGRGAGQHPDHGPQLPEHAGPDARRRAAAILPGRRDQQPGAHHAGVGERTAQHQYDVPTRRHDGDQPVDSRPAGLRSGHRGHRDRQRRDEQLRSRPGHGRRRRRQRAGQERHQQPARLGLRVLQQLATCGPGTSSCRRPARSPRAPRTSSAARSADASCATSCSSSAASKPRIRARSAGHSSGPRHCCCPCPRPSSAAETSRRPARRSTIR